MRRFPNTRRFVPAILCLGAMMYCIPKGVFASSTDEKPDTQIDSAFAAGLGNFGQGKSPLLLETVRSGHNWTLTGYDRKGASVKQLNCLLCTQTEVTYAAAFLGDMLGRQYRNEPAATYLVKSEGSTLSIDGIPVLPILLNEETQTDEARTEDRTTRYRWALVSAGLGVAAGVIGGFFLWMEGNCASDDCSQLHSHSLKGVGIALLVSGALLETTAILLWRLRRKSERR